MGIKVVTEDYEAYTNFLFPFPSVLYGIGRLIDLGVVLDLYNDSLSTAEADYLALHSDWMSVGKDFKAVVKGLPPTEDEISVAAR